MPDWLQFVTAGVLVVIVIQLGTIASAIGEIKDKLEEIEINTREISTPSNDDSL